jgi:hypothetical protein
LNIKFLWGNSSSLYKFYSSSCGKWCGHDSRTLTCIWHAYAFWND